jgi:cell division protein FtsL
LATRQKTLQTDFIKNQNHVSSAQKAAEDAKKQAMKANNELVRIFVVIRMPFS